MVVPDSIIVVRGVGDTVEYRELEGSVFKEGYAEMTVPYCSVVDAVVY